MRPIQWWIDGPSGAGLYVLQDASGNPVPPKSGWVALNGVQPPVPEVHVIEDPLPPLRMNCSYAIYSYLFYIFFLSAWLSTIIWITRAVHVCTNSTAHFIYEI